MPLTFVRLRVGEEPVAGVDVALTSWVPEEVPSDLPQLEAVTAVVGGEEQGAVHVRQVFGLGAGRSRG